MKGEKTISEGMLIPCLMTGTDEWSNAEIIKIRESEIPSGSTAEVDSDDAKRRLYYVHYVDFNKRLDCWVTEDRLDVSKARAKGQEPTDKEIKKEDPDGSSRCFSPTPTSAIKDVSNLGTPTSG